MQFKIPTDALRFLVADRPEQRKEFESGALRTDDQGRPLFQVRLLAMDGEQSAPIKVGVVGDPQVPQGTFVVPAGLTLNVVDRRGDSVTWWTAERLDAAAVPGGRGPSASGKASGTSGKGSGE
ncbi:hypothetical protein E1287_43340 [Actinomadura sp. KC06]|uniref:hypothetical protein n=1 Tax=Actinomadura sp. KC06 TaxID=2530369 RepID=UPI00104BAC0A|nr:hypothetical protein [Actinomadura sp. KC06]TDD13285.1 hypothetical protein E1287_43340 [Actinomadura sp. KC06]